MARIAVGGFHHETNTFARAATTLEHFRNSASYPAMPRGARLREELSGQNLPIAGFMAEADERGHEIVPTLWAGASPAAAVTRQAYETICGAVIADLQAALPVDAVYLCLHGAMVTEDYEDGEAELLRRVRAIIGDLPMVASLDFHANISPTMAELTTAMVVFRTYPHIDMAETGQRAARLLERILQSGEMPAKAFRKLPFLIPLVWQCTSSDPAKAIFSRLAAREGGPVWSLSFAPGFPLADVSICGPAVLGYGASQEAVERAVSESFDDICAAEGDFAGKLYGPDEAVQHALRAYAGKPIVLADTQDNPGAGTQSDTVWLLEALLRLGAADAALAIVCDPEAAEAAQRAGVGAEITLGLGAKSGGFGEPIRETFVVEALSDGTFAGTGRMSRGLPFRLGPTALLRVGGVRVVVASRKTQANDQAIFRHLGLDPARQRILVLKSSVHFRDDFQDLAGEILIVEAPGPNIADHRKLPYRRLPPGLRVMPLGPASPAPEQSLCQPQRAGTGGSTTPSR